MQGVVEIEITDIAFGGKGVARHEGCVIFVPFVIPGERVMAQITRKKKSFAEAALLSVITASPDRVGAPCLYYTQCGGCVYQHIAYPRQLIIKAGQVESALRRIAKLETVPMRPMIAATKPFGYRNRIRVHVSGGRCGFFALGSREVVDVKSCVIAEASVNKALTGLRRGGIEERDYSLRAPGGMGPFFEQTNDEMAEVLVKEVETAISSGGTLIDAYCGAGLFAKKLRGRFEKIIGIEMNAAAVAHAMRDAKPGESYVQGDVAEKLPKILSSATGDIRVILDPPAEGLAPEVTAALMAHPPAELLYVSCDPSTMARDISRLTPKFAVQAVTPLDMFPQTAEIECLVHLVRL